MSYFPDSKQFQEKRYSKFEYSFFNEIWKTPFFIFVFIFKQQIHKETEIVKTFQRIERKTHLLCDLINSKNSFGNLIKGRTGVGI